MRQTDRFVRDSVLTCGLSLCLLTTALMAHSQKYGIKALLPYAGGAESFAHSINKNGTIAGGASDKTTISWGSWWTTAGGSPVVALGNPSYPTWFVSISDTDDAVGSLLAGPNDLRPLLWTGNALTELPRGDFWQGQANSVNEAVSNGSYVIAGRVFMTDSIPEGTPSDAPIRRTRAVLWNKDGGMQLLDTLEGGEGKIGNAAMSMGKITPLGAVVGGSSAMKGKTHEQAVLWGWPTGTVSLWLNSPDVLNGGSGGRVNHARDGRYVGGYYYPYEGAYRTACYWPTPTECIEIGTLYGGNSEAIAVRNSNYTPLNRPEIVGYSDDPNSPPYHHFSFAFRWNPTTGMKDLNTLVVTDQSWILREARDIDQEGRIVGWGMLNGQIRGFLLTPIKIKKVFFPVTALKSQTTQQDTIEMLEAVPEATRIVLRSSNAAVRVPGWVTVPRGQARVTFPVTVGGVTQRTEVTITLTLGEQIVTQRVSVVP